MNNDLNKTFLDLVNQSGDLNDSEDDVDFVPNSSSSSDDDEAESDAAELAPVDERSIEQLYKALKDSVAPKTINAGLLIPACQTRLVSLLNPNPARVTDLFTSEISFQPQNITSADWRHRSASPQVSVDFAREIMTQMDHEYNHIRKRRMRFAGKLYDIEIDPRTQQQKLTTCDEDEGIAEIQRVLISKPETMTAMAKSRADWQAYMRETDEAFKLKQHRKSTGAVLRKKIFLQNVAAASSTSGVSGRRRRRAA